VNVACSTLESYENDIRSIWRIHLKGRNHYEDPRLKVRMLLKIVLTKRVVGSVVLFDPWRGSEADSFERGNEPSSFIRGG